MLISSSWQIAGGKIKWDVTVPPNTTATAHVPTTNAQIVTESGKPAADSDGVRFERSEQGAAVYALSSGVYSFEAE